MKPKSFTVTDGVATCHRFPDEASAFRALRAHPFATRHPSLESSGDKTQRYCTVVDIPEDEERYGIQLHPRT
jgi:hypothetical protein